MKKYHPRAEGPRKISFKTPNLQVSSILSRMAEIGAIVSNRNVWILASSLSALSACCEVRVFITGSNFGVLIEFTLGRLYRFLVRFLDSFVKLRVHESLSSRCVLSETSTTCSAPSSSSEYLESYDSIMSAQERCSAELRWHRSLNSFTDGVKIN